MSDMVYTLTPLAETVGLWRFRGDLRDSARKHHLKTLETLPETVGHWRFQGGTGDETSNGHTLSVSGGSPVYSAGYTELGTTSVAFATPVVASIAGVSATDFNMGTSNFTIEFIAKAANTTGTEFFQKRFPTNVASWRVYIENVTGKWVLFIDDNSNSAEAKTVPSILGLWNYVAFSVDRTGGIITPYFNGVASATTSIAAVTGSLDNSDDLRFVTGVGGPTYDEVCITKRTMSAAEIETRYSGSFEFMPSTGNHLSTSTITSSNYAVGYTEPGLTAIETTRGVERATLPHVSAPDFDMYYSDFTIEAIVKCPNPGDQVSTYTLINKISVTAGGWALQVDNKATNTGGVRLQMGDSLYDDINNPTATTVNDDNYHYIACVVNRKSAEVRMYIDSVLDSNFPVSLVGVVSGSIACGSELRLVDLDGFMDEVCVTKRALTAAEIATRYAGHGDPLVIEYSGSADITTNIISATLDSFDIKLKHPCNHVLAAGRFTLNKCPRCLGTGTFYDIKFDAVGRPSRLSVEDKLIQSLEKMVLTSENRFHEDLVVGLHGRLGNLVDDAEAIIKYDLIQAVATLKDGQRGVTNLSSRAQIARLDNVSVVREDPTSLRYIVELTTVSGEHVELSGTIHISGQ